ncbi:hypothetical protein PsorP6_015043 [Peronosclerospora sorghi]|uniref:Uncharacterized protein n=1 Tax=Peronosclerospora sorghi TaxID=230839 RepID=A0ACC0VUK7_9STRA|nr:hypothetical protein PsorP6_015043 [Peronosclerospora sorghi]
MVMICTNPFFSQLQTLDKDGEWLSFSSLLPLPRRGTLYIRHAYKVIADQDLLNVVVDMAKYALVTGTPGINSVFMYYAMWRLIQDQKRVLLFNNMDISTLMGRRCTSIYHCHASRTNNFGLWTCGALWIRATQQVSPNFPILTVPFCSQV